MGKVNVDAPLSLLIFPHCRIPEQWGTTNVNGYWVYPIAMSIYFVVGAGYLSSDKNVTRMIEFYDTSNYRTFPASNGQELGSTTIWCIGKK